MRSQKYTLCASIWKDPLGKICFGTIMRSSYRFQ
uniref:Uncharacterized protein n=1 Tax=Anguilla anguilla TaxID=7936 RepID=A0A0E9QU09_ANGAN